MVVSIDKRSIAPQREFLAVFVVVGAGVIR